MDDDDLMNRFTYHPSTQVQSDSYPLVRGSCLSLARLFNTMCPDSRELATAITRLEEAAFWANAAIARNGVPRG
jgi:hypothetical protein